MTGFIGNRCARFAPSCPLRRSFLVWDLIAIAGDVWTYNPRYLTGIELPLGMPLEEALFFVVIPLCGLLTYNAVSTILNRTNRHPDAVQEQP